MISINEIISTLRGAKEGAVQDIATVKEHRGKLGLVAGAAGTYTLLKKNKKLLEQTIPKSKRKHLSGGWG